MQIRRCWKRGHRKKVRFVAQGPTFYHPSPLSFLRHESFAAPLMSPLPLYGNICALYMVDCAQQWRKYQQKRAKYKTNLRWPGGKNDGERWKKRETWFKKMSRLTLSVTILFFIFRNCVTANIQCDSCECCIVSKLTAQERKRIRRAREQLKPFVWKMGSLLFARSPSGQ